MNAKQLPCFTYDLDIKIRFGRSHYYMTETKSVKPRIELSATPIFTFTPILLQKDDTAIG